MFTLLLSLAVVVTYGATTPCSMPTEDDWKYVMSLNANLPECEQVDFAALRKSDIYGSHVCQNLRCINALGRKVYERIDVFMCLKLVCSSRTNCSDPTEEEMTCMINAANKSADAIADNCQGVDFPSLREKKILESKICSYPNCIKTLQNNVYIPCKRADYGPCIEKDCSLNCRDPTAEELKCMTDAAANGNAGSDLATNCQGVDFDALKDKKLNDSHICEHRECIETLQKDLYVPCKREDLGLCLEDACASVCSPVTPTELDCMNRAAANATASLQSCGGVDFDALKKGDVKGSKICDHHDCIAALEKSVYIPCKRTDLSLCILSACVD